MMQLNLSSAYSVLWLSAGKNPFHLSQESLPPNSQVYFGKQHVTELVNLGFQLREPRKDCAISTGFSRKSLVEYAECMGMEAPLHLGLDVMTKLHLYFAMKENMLYFTGADDERTATTASPIAPLQ